MRFAHALPAVCFAGIVLIACGQSDTPPKQTDPAKSPEVAQVTPEATRQPVSNVPDFKELIESGEKIHSPLDYDPDLNPETVYAAPTAPPTPAPLNRIRIDLAETYNGQALSGYLSRLAGETPRGCILLLHDLMGLTEGVRNVADDFAAEKFVVLALNLYDTAPADRRAAMQDLRALHKAPPVDRIKAAQAWLREQAVPGQVMPVGVVAYGVTTQWALALTASENRPAATVIHYGELPTKPEDLLAIHGPLLGFFSEMDGWVTPAKVLAFDTALSSNSVIRDINIYGIPPGFGLDPETKDQEAYARETRKQIVDFFRQYFSASDAR